MEEKIQYYNPYTEKWVDKLPKSFIDKLVKTRLVKINKSCTQKK